MLQGSTRLVVDDAFRATKEALAVRFLKKRLQSVVARDSLLAANSTRMISDTLFPGGMEDFDIPTSENRLIQRGSTLYQVMIAVRGQRGPDKKVVRDKALQRELKMIVALMLDEDGESGPVVGRKIRVELKRFERQADVGKLFSFTRNRRSLTVNPTVTCLLVTIL